MPLQRGQIVAERAAETASYWSIIPQFGRIWRDPGEEGPWSRAALPLMLVGDTENHSHQGVATFRYKGREVSELEFQFVQQTAPYSAAAAFHRLGARAHEGCAACGS